MIRISDIAKDMKLSEATISNALTGKGRMKPETREAILARAEQLGYRVRVRRTFQGAAHPVVIAENLESSFITSILSGILDAARSILPPQGLIIPAYSLQIRDETLLRNPDTGVINDQTRKLLSSVSHEVSGILYLSQYARKTDGLLSGLDIPVVSVFCTRTDGQPFIHYDDHQGAQLAVDTLLDEGRRKIAMISGPIDSIGMCLRSSGYQQALVEHGIPYDPRLVRIGDWDAASGYTLTRQLLAETEDIDGIFAQNDFIGLGAIHAIREKGLSVPGDISVIGFDNSMACRLSHPALTSIQPPFAQMGSDALAELLSMTAKKEADRRSSLLPCSLVRRESTRG